MQDYTAEKEDLIRLWDDLQVVCRDATDIDVRVIAASDKGLVCDVRSLLGIMPPREIPKGTSPKSYVGRTIRAKILHISEQDATITVSHRAALEPIQRAQREAVLAELAPGKRYCGTVRNVTDYGAFVDIGAGVEGLVHRSQLSWDNSVPAAVVAPGEPIDVIVLSIENGRIALGHRELTEDPWVVATRDLHVGDIVEGRVASVASFGLFVRIADDAEGLVHTSEFPWTGAEDMHSGDSVRVRILGIDAAKRRIRLSLRDVERNDKADAATDQGRAKLADVFPPMR